MRPRQRLKRLYKKIPSVNCVEGCHECCGIVPFSQSEWDAIKDKRVANSIDCPYIEDKRCGIYNQRPLLCRLFGASEEKRMQCPHGGTCHKPLSIKETKDLMRDYLILFQ